MNLRTPLLISLLFCVVRAAPDFSQIGFSTMDGGTTGEKGFFNRVGIIIQKKKNIIIRNIKFTMKNVPISKSEENKMVGMMKGVQTLLGDPDCIGNQADSGAAIDEQKNSWSRGTSGSIIANSSTRIRMS